MWEEAQERVQEALKAEEKIKEDPKKRDKEWRKVIEVEEKKQEKEKAELEGYLKRNEDGETETQPINEVDLLRNGKGFIETE